MAQQTKEFLNIPAKFTDSIYQSLEDGDFNALKDFPNFLDDLLAIQPGVEGINQIREENATMSIEDRDSVFDFVQNAMPNVNPDDRYDITSAMTGFLSLFRIAWRKGYEKGLEEGRQTQQA